MLSGNWTNGPRIHTVAWRVAEAAKQSTYLPGVELDRLYSFLKIVQEK